MPRYKKKPVVIEARGPLTHQNMQEIAQWSDGIIAKSTLVIDTLEGPMQAKVGDYIIKGVQGEFYPCRGDIFEDTYELVSS